MEKFTIYNLQFTIKLISLLFTLYIVHCTFYIPVFAYEATPSAQINDIGTSRIDPSSPFYFLKTIREGIETKFAQTVRVKSLRQLEFATRRLREARTLIGKREDLIPPTLERYMAILSTLKESYPKSQQQFADDLRNNLTIHLQILQKMYSLVSDNRAKMEVRSTMNKIVQRKDVIDIAKLPVCNLFDKVASSSALNQTEQYVWKNRAQSCFESLEKSNP